VASVVGGIELMVAAGFNIEEGESDSNSGKSDLRIQGVYACTYVYLCTTVYR
jgi:hypothetical protein